MHVFVQSAFLQALGYAIANSLWQVALTWLIFMLVNSVFRFSAAAKYRLAVAAQFIGFIWFLVTLQFYYTQAGNTNIASAITAGHQAVGNTISITLINWLIKAEQALPYLSIAYLLLMGFLSVRWLLGYQRTQTMRNGGLQKMPVDWRLFVKRIAAQLGIKQEIKVFLSEHVTTPLTIGFLKPVILIPVAGITHLTTEQVEAVLLHELAHIKRYDYLLNMVISMVELALFFNPFTQLLSRTIQKERENSCDDWVLQFQYNATEYAEALLRIAYLQQAPVFAMTAAGNKNELLVRVKRMIGQKEAGFNYRRQLLAFVLVTGMLCSIAWLSPASSNNKATGKPTTAIRATVSAQKPPVLQLGKKQPAATTMAAAENPLFNPAYFLPDDVKSAIKKDMAVAKSDIEEAVEAVPVTLIAAIPEMVSGALNEAQIALAGEGRKYKQQADEISKVKAGFDKERWGTDSVSAIKRKNMPPGLKLELAGSMKQVQLELSKAGKDIEAALPFAADMIFDNNNINSQVSDALMELKKLDLEKVVSDVLRYADLSEDDKVELKKLKNIPLSIKEKQRKRLHKDPHNKTSGNDLIPIVPAPTVTLPAVASIKRPDVTLSKEENELQAVQIKRAILNKVSKLLQTKLVPVVNRESKKGNQVLLSNSNICL